MIISKIISTIVKKGMLIVKILALGNADVKTVFNILPFGIDSNPSKDYRAIFADTDVKGEKILIGVINQNVLTDVGEIRIFSENEGQEVFSIYLKNDGTCEFGGNADNMVRYSELKSGFDELKGDLNDLVTAFNQHMHATAATGAPSMPTPVPDIIPVITSSADISESKIDNIKTN